MLYNLTLDESTLYYLNGTDLTQYNSSDKKTKIIETGVFDFHLILSDPQQDVNIFEYQVILVKEQQLQAIADKKFFASFVTHYCAMNPTNNLCIKKQIKLLSSSDCPSGSTEEFCKVSLCENTPDDSSCITSSCATNTTCWAIFCGKDYRAHKYNQCNLIKKLIYATDLNNARDYIFDTQNITFLVKNTIKNDQPSPQKDQNKQISAGLSAGISVAICVTVFSIILIIIILLQRKKYNQVKSTRIQSPSDIMQTKMMQPTQVI
ncbi:Hypothetical_protein [Hexamita inflata]|uniref:Hypothetical_protein n=1 Tax=Hexamita inflata TaxID=28002 RepID=A0AA86P0H7_9EUKA|nr:Hypothetical protein HINF_LOCUS17892 [Hexamita inflata]